MKLTLQEFRTKAYEILTADGYLEKDGKMFYPESAIMEMLEFMYDEFKGEIDLDKQLADVVERAFKKLEKGKGGKS